MSETNTGMKATQQFIKEFTQRMANMSSEEYEADRQKRNMESELRKIDLLNAEVAESKYFDCPICKNKGVIAFMNEYGFLSYKDCECKRKRECYRMMERSGINPEVLKRFTFQNFEDTELWQKDMKFKAMEYAKSDLSEWLVLSGQSGCGKTHLCTAVAKHLLAQGHEVKYMLWGDIARRLTALKFKEAEYDEFFSKIVSAEVLYIDDFLKTYRDPYIAFDVINARYTARSNRPTIISTEMNLDAIRNMDEATAGRIRQRSENYCYQIKQDPNRNYRYKRKPSEND